MNQNLPPRRVLPRWRMASIAAGTFESQGVRTGSSSIVEHVIDPRNIAIEKLEEWKAGSAPGLAAELISFGVFPELRPLVKDVAREVLLVPANYSAITLDIARTIAGLNKQRSHSNDGSNADQISRIRRRLREFPANPAALMDFALLQATMGNARAAERAVITATTLAPSHRLIVRGAVRFHIHNENPERALNLLSRTANVSSDPWLLAAEISVNNVMGKRSLRLKKARQLVDAILVPSVHYSELASAVATESLVSGNRKESRKAFNKALASPTENSVAQAQWAANELGIPFNARTEWLEGKEFHELRCMRANSDGEFEQVVLNANEWSRIEPFSSRPMVMASFAFGVLGKFREVEQAARQGLVANPTDASLLNNMYYSLSSQGRLEEADVYLRKVLKEQIQDPAGHTLANLGLYHLLHGNFDLSEQCYRAAVTWFEKRHAYGAAANALACYARALQSIGDDRWQQIGREIEALPNQPGLVAARAILSSISGAEVGALVNVPALERPKRKDWHYDPVSNVLTLKSPKYL